jgi:hypothetical protein
MVNKPMNRRRPQVTAEKLHLAMMKAVMQNATLNKASPGKEQEYDDVTIQAMVGGDDKNTLPAQPADIGVQLKTLEAMVEGVHRVKAVQQNLKVTSPEDLLVVRHNAAG